MILFRNIFHRAITLQVASCLMLDSDLWRWGLPSNLSPFRASSCYLYCPQYPTIFTLTDSFFHLLLYRIKWCLPGKLFVQPVLVLWRIISVNSPHRMGPVQWLNASKYTDGREINKLCTAEREKLQRKQTFVTRMVGLEGSLASAVFLDKN